MVTGRRILLLADDSPATQKVVSMTFADEGLEVVAVGDGTEALRRIEAGLMPDIVLADVLMPGLTGYELCERVKGDSRLAGVPVVLLVGTFEPFNEAEARRVGADTVLTKPFQSIRDLVSKVGSLLGGSKPEAETEAAPPAEAPQRYEAAQSDPLPAAAPPLRHEDAQPFPDFGLDDEMIEARPAASYQAPAESNAPRASEAHASDLHAPIVEENPPAPLAAAAAPDSFADTIREPFADAAPINPRHTAEVFAEASPSYASSAVVEEPRVAQSAFAARAAGAAAADDALLDLDIEPSASLSEADDFILDLDDDEPTPAPVAHAAAPAAEAPQSYVAETAPVEATAPDAPSALAEATHGETTQDYGSLFEPSHNDEAAQAGGGEVAHALDSGFAREVIAQDEPQQFGGHAPGDLTGTSPDEMSSAPRSFVEPEVVPAEEPSPAVAEAEFTDGSVEGDVAKPPAWGFDEPAFETTAEPVSEAIAAEPMVEAAPIQDASPAPASSTAGFEMGAARAGVREGLSADQLSPEMIDAIARRVVELMSDKVVREIAWEVVPELSELLIRQKLEADARKQ